MARHLLCILGTGSALSSKKGLTKYGPSWYNGDMENTNDGPRLRICEACSVGDEWDHWCHGAGVCDCPRCREEEKPMTAREAKIAGMVIGIFEASGRRYGSRRITAVLLGRGFRVGRGSVVKIMRKFGFKGKVR